MLTITVLFIPQKLFCSPVYSQVLEVAGGGQTRGLTTGGAAVVVVGSCPRVLQVVCSSAACLRVGSR